ncbi:MAG: MarR family transcriptional regulator [Clostridia bacterium]|nr:MarR family transcriptional regulator [Clostridia bacterium]
MDKQELIIKYYEVSGNIKLRRLSDILNDNLRGTYVILRAIKNSEGEVVAGDIAKKLGISTARVAVALNMLDQKGYIKKARCESDARKTDVSITEKGLEILEEWQKKICDEIGVMLDKLTEEEAEQLLDIMIKLTK